MEAGARHVALVVVGRDLGALGFEHRAVADGAVADAHRARLELERLRTGAQRPVGAEPRELNRLVVGTGPGSFTGVRMGLAAARGLAFALDLRLAGVSTLDALAAGAPGALPVVDAGRREVFTLVDGNPAVAAPGELRLEPGTTCVGDGAVRYREVLEALGATIPPRESELHLPRARFHAELAREFVDPETVEPLYLRLPDAEQAR